MPFCPNCKVEYEEGVSVCADCGVALVAVLEPAPEWVKVYEGAGVTLRMVADELQRLGIPVATAHSEYVGQSYDVGIFGPDQAPYELVVPRDAYDSRRAEIEAVIGTADPDHATEPPVDLAAQAEAEEDSQVLGCPTCLRYFHQALASCPGDGSPLLPAVECFAEGQAAPDYVVVAHGAESDVTPVADRLRGAGFQPRVEVPRGWSQAVVELPWSELTDRTADVDSAVLRA